MCEWVWGCLWIFAKVRACFLVCMVMVSVCVGVSSVRAGARGSVCMCVYTHARPARARVRVCACGCVPSGCRCLIIDGRKDPLRTEVGAYPAAHVDRHRREEIAVRDVVIGNTLVHAILKESHVAFDITAVRIPCPGPGPGLSSCHCWSVRLCHARPHRIKYTSVVKWRVAIGEVTQRCNRARIRVQKNSTADDVA